MNLRCIKIANAAGLTSARQAGDETFYHCPNHDDQHPSLQINDEKNCFFCGPCGRSSGAWEFAAFLAKKDPADKSGISQWLREKGLQNDRPSRERSENAGKNPSWKDIKHIWEEAVPVSDERASSVPVP